MALTLYLLVSTRSPELLNEWLSCTGLHDWRASTDSYSLNELQFILFAGVSHAKFHMIGFNSMKHKN